MLMKKNHLLATMKTCLFVFTGMFLASCAQDGYTEETFVGTYGGYQLSAPDASTVKVKPSTDQKEQTISWSTVTGAISYLVSIYEGEGGENVIMQDSLVRRASITIPRKARSYYRIDIRTAYNEAEDNAASEGSAEYSWDTFIVEISLPAGVDFVNYLKEHPVSEDALVDGALCAVSYNLTAGANYTMSDMVDFGAYSVTLTCDDPENKAKLTFTGETSGFETSGSFVLENLYIDAFDSKAAFIAMSKTPAIAPIVVNAWGADYNFYCDKEDIEVRGCDIHGLTSYFFWDNQVSCWFPTTLTVDDTIVEFATPTDSKAISGGYIWTNKGSGYIRNLTITNSTFYNTGLGDVKYFVQYGGFGQSQTGESLGWADNTITYDHCTFYHVCSSGQWGNYNGTAGKATSYWNMTNCIFYDCSSSGVARRFLAGKQNQATATFLNNTYQQKDKFDNPANFDNSGTDIQEAPNFKDPSNGDFSISGSKQATLGTGDPRWLPKE